MGRALVIRTAGDQEIAGAIVDGMTRNITLQTGERAIIRGEFEKLRGKPLRRETREKPSKTPRRVRLRKYAVKPHGRVYRAILGVWGLLWYSVDGLMERCRR